MIIEGTITRETGGCQLDIPLYIDTNTSTHSHWGHDIVTPARTSTSKKRGRDTAVERC